MKKFGLLLLVSWVAFSGNAGEKYIPVEDLTP